MRLDDFITYLADRGLPVSNSSDLPGEVFKLPTLFK
jgi:hypothetical protein